MRIPEIVKIGGLTYKVNVTENIKLGEDYGAEIRFRELEINIREMPRERMNRCFLHEVFHGIYENLGYIDHDEKQIDEVAGAFYGVIVDNPEMFVSNKLVTITPENPMVSSSEPIQA